MALALGGSLADRAGTAGRSGAMRPSTALPHASVQRQRAARWLSFCTFGPTSADLDAVEAHGPAAWLELQLNAPPSLSVTDWIERKGPPGFEEPQVPVFISTRVRAIDWKCIWAPDMVRQRVSYALSQILVVSELGTNRTVPFALANFWDILNRGATGNFRDLLREVSQSLDMASYLTYLNNRKADLRTGRQPDENYARELMQLFTLGLWELNEDGSLRRDAAGRLIPTYDQDDVIQLARVFTGWYSPGPDQQGRTLGFGVDNTSSYESKAWARPLVVDSREHSPEAVHGLGGKLRLPAGTGGIQALDAALDVLFEHPNCPPFIALNLIRRLTTSNPSAAYVSRVSKAFKDDGQGRRGEMKAVLRAVFLDPEVLHPDRPEFGRVIEPYVQVIGLARLLGAHVDAKRQRFAVFTLHERFSTQRPFTAPSVFNFNQLDFSPQGPVRDAGWVAPELQNCDEYGATLRFNGMAGFCEGIVLPEALFERLADPIHDAELVDAQALLLAGRLLPADDRADLLRILARLPRGAGSSAYPARASVLQGIAWFISIHPDMAVRQ